MSAIKYQIHLDNKEKERMSFAEYCATEGERQSTQDQVDHYTLILCENLVMDYKIRRMQSHKRALFFAVNAGNMSEADYHQKRIDEITNGDPEVAFPIEEGRKYYKIIMEQDNSSTRSVHAFVDKKTGDVFKPASFKSPAKGARYNLLDDKSREECYENADWAGGYLYMK